MKKTLMTASALMVLSSFAPAMAWERIATGSSGFGGFSGTTMTGDLVGTMGDSLGTNMVDTSTTPLSATAGATLDQLTGGLGVSRTSLKGELLQEGNTNAEADVNAFDWETEAASTTTLGTGGILGLATGNNSVVVGGLAAASHEESSAMDKPLGGSDTATAKQTVMGGVRATSFGGGLGSSLSSAETKGEADSTSTADH